MLVKFASYNIQYGVGQDGVYDLGRIADALEDQDVACVQEATTARSVCNDDDQPKILAARLNRYSAYAPAFEVDASEISPEGAVIDRRRGFGNMVLSRWPILYSRPHSLPRPQTGIPPEFHPRVDFPRVALETVIDCGGRPIRVVSLHLSHLPGVQRQCQIDVLKSILASAPQEAALWEVDPRIAAWSDNHPAPAVPETSLVFGDFNFKPDSPDYARMLEPLNGAAGLVDGWAVAQSSSAHEHTSVDLDGGMSRLDYMFVTPDLQDQIVSARVDHDVTASDHFPLLFTVEL